MPDLATKRITRLRVALSAVLDGTGLLSGDPSNTLAIDDLCRPVNYAVTHAIADAARARGAEALLERVACWLTTRHDWRVPRGYSRDLRERLLQAVASGRSVVEIAQLTGVSPSRLHRWKRLAAAGAALTPGVSPGGPRKIGAAAEAALRAQVAACPDATLAEHCTRWSAAGGAEVSVATMSRALARLGLPLKKRP